MTTTLPKAGRVTLDTGATASGPIRLERVARRAFLRVGENGHTTLFALEHVIEVRAIDTRPVLSRLLDAVAEAFLLPPEQCIGKGRHREQTEVRFAFWYCAHHLGIGTTHELALAAGRTDHGAASHGIARARDLLTTDPQFRARVERVLEQFQHINKPESHDQSTQS